jgi:hypothetical protein
LPCVRISISFHCSGRSTRAWGDFRSGSTSSRACSSRRPSPTADGIPGRPRPGARRSPGSRRPSA